MPTEWTPMDIDVIREEWGYADEAGQREWALEHADDLMAEVERLRDKVEQLRMIANVNGDWNVKYAEMEARAEAAEAKARAALELHPEGGACCGLCGNSECCPSSCPTRAALADPTREPIWLGPGVDSLQADPPERP